MEIERYLHELREKGREYAEAKGQRVYLEHFRKSKLAILMKEYALVLDKIGEQDREARANPEYLQILEGLRQATGAEENARWQLTALQNRMEYWRTTEATKRQEMKSL